MKTNRPIIKVPTEPLDSVTDLVSVTLIILMVGFTGYHYSSLPETIPTHFNAAGQADGYGSKTSIWLLPAINAIMFTGLFILNKYPHLHNYMVNITAENALKNYRFSTRLVRLINFLCTVLFAYIQYKIILGARAKTNDLGDWFLPVVIGSSILLPIALIIYQNKLNKD